MMIPTSKDGDGSLSPVVWSCETMVETLPVWSYQAGFTSFSAKQGGKQPSVSPD